MQTRRSARAVLSGLAPGSLVLVGLSGGADSLALAAAVAAESGSVRAGAIVVDHGLQPGSDSVAEHAASQARGLGLDPVLVRRVDVGAGGDGARDRRSGGPEAAAREARYAEFLQGAADVGACAILVAHTRDDQAEQVLLALARGSGTRSIAGIASERELGEGVSVLRPFLAEVPPITRATTEAACEELGLEVWNDPHNKAYEYARVRVRREVLPALERELGRGVAAGLARSADLAREDAEALDAWADAVLGAHERQVPDESDVWSVPVSALAEVPAAVRQRVIHRIARRRFGASLTREQVLAIAALVTQWRGQGPIHAPGMRVTRTPGSELLFEKQVGSPRTTALR